MRSKRNSNSIDPTQNHFALTQANFGLPAKLVPWLEGHQKQDLKFKGMVLVRLARIESMLVQIQACQMVRHWKDERVPEEKQQEFIKEVEDMKARTTNQLSMRMIRTVYGQSGEADLPRKGRRKWSGWEIRRRC